MFTIGQPASARTASTFDLQETLVNDSAHGLPLTMAAPQKAQAPISASPARLLHPLQQSSCELFEDMLRVSCLGDRSLINQSFPGLDLSSECSNANSLGTPMPWNRCEGMVWGAEL